MAYNHSTKSIKVMLFNICKLTVLKSYGGDFFSVGVTQRMFAAVFNSRKSWNSEKVPMDWGGGRIIPFKCQNIKQISTRVSTWERFSKPRNSSEDYWGINSKNGVNQHRLTQIILFNFYETKNLINNSNRLDIIFLDLYNIFGLAEHILTKTSQKKNN